MTGSTGTSEPLRVGGGLTGSTPNNYQLIGEVGHGGMASVHLALLSGEAGFQKLVALKQLKQSLSEDAELMAMFLDEARLAARLNHPNVVQTYEVGRRGDQPFIAMEFIEGQPLSRMQRLPGSGVPLPLQLCIIADVLSGLHHAHELRDFGGAPLGVVHRDISPQNVLVSYDGQAKVVDFGIAKAQTQANETGFGVVKGKLSYMSPEQAAGESLDRRSDLFAVGVMLWEAGARTRLWPGIPLRERLRRLESGSIPELAQFDPEVPAALDRVCRRALEYSPARRYQSAAELEIDIQELLAEPALRATRRDVAAFMGMHFEAQRSHTRKMIEGQLGHLSIRPSLSAALEAQPPHAETPSSSASTLVGVSERPAPPASLQPVGRTDPPPPSERQRKALAQTAAGTSLVLLLGVGCWFTLRGQSAHFSGPAEPDHTGASPGSPGLPRVARPLPLPAAALSTSRVSPALSTNPVQGASSSAPKPSQHVAPKSKSLVPSSGGRRGPSSSSASVDENGVSNFGGRR